MTEIKLKPCPFCGGDAVTKISVLRGNVYDGVRFSICCSSCSIRHYKDLDVGNTFDNVEETMNKVIEAWNRRAKDETD